MLDTIFSLLPVILIVLAVLAIVLAGYVKAPPDQAYIISGLIRRGLDVAHQQQNQNNDHCDYNRQESKNGVKHFRDLLTI